MNSIFKTVFLLTVLSALFLFMGYSLGGAQGMKWAFLISLIMNFVSYWFSDKIVLAMHQAREIGAGHPSGVYEIIQELCLTGKLPMPKVYVVPQWVPNAFATGRDPNHAAVAVTEGILKILEPQELRGVLAHEISHIRNRDILISTIVATFASAIMYLADMMRWSAYTGGYGRDGEGRSRGANPLAMILTMILAPFAAMLIQMAVSRTREYMADHSGAQISQDPEALASALEKISDPSLVQSLKNYSGFEGSHAAFSHLYIVHPITGESLLSLFSTHPPVKERIRRLRSMAGGSFNG